MRLRLEGGMARASGGRAGALARALSSVLLVGATASCSDPTGFRPTANSTAGAGEGGTTPGAGGCASRGLLLTAEGTCIDPADVGSDCPASQEWVPNTPPIAVSGLFKPLSHPAP